MQGANINRRRQDSARPIHLAAERGHKGVVEELMMWGADIAVTRKDGATPLYLATLHGHHNLVELLLGEKDKLDVNASTKEGWTGLHAAAARCGSEIESPHGSS